MWLWMWRMNCGCNPILENSNIKPLLPKVNTYGNIHLQNTTDKSHELKCEIIADFYDILSKLECGIQPNLEEILEEISVIQMAQNYNVTKQMFTTLKEEEDDFLRKSKYLSEFNSEEDRLRALRNLGVDTVRHIILSKEDYENLEYFDKNAIYFITE